MPLPQPVQSSGQVLEVSPLLHAPSPQYGPTTTLSVQLFVQVEQVAGGLLYAGVAHGVLVLAAPSSHCSPVSIRPLPQPVQSVGHVVLVSPLPHVPSPQNGPTTVLIVQLVVQVEQVFGGL